MRAGAIARGLVRNGRYHRTERPLPIGAPPG